MAGGAKTRANIVAGSFLLLSLALGVWMSFTMSRRSQFKDVVEFTVRLGLDEGAAGLKQDSEVTLGGQPVGRVVGVDFETAPGTERVPTAVLVRVEVRRDLTLYDDAVILLERPLLGSLSTLNIASGGEGTMGLVGASPRIEAGDVIDGRLAPPAFLAQAGVGPTQTDQIRRAIADAQEGLARFNEMVKQATPRIDQGIADLSQLSQDVRGAWTRWSPRVDTTLEDAGRAAAQLSPTLEDARSALSSAKGVAEDIRGVVGENRAEVRSILTQLDEASTRVNGAILDEVTLAMQRAGGALESLERTAESARGLLSQETPNVRRILANLRLMADQLKLTALEVRSQPWRLLVQPTTKELREQVVYDAARSYASAASDVRAAAEALETARGEGTPAVDALAGELGDSLQRFREAEDLLLRKLREP